MLVTQDSVLEWIQKEMGELRAENAQLKKDFETLKEIVNRGSGEPRVLSGNTPCDASEDVPRDAPPTTCGVKCTGTPVQHKPIAYFPPTDKLRLEFGFNALRVVNSVSNMFSVAGYKVKFTCHSRVEDALPGDVFVIFHHRKAHDALFLAVNPLMEMDIKTPATKEPTFFKVELVDRKIMSIQQTEKEDEVFVHITDSKDSSKFVGRMCECDEKTDEAQEKIKAFLKKN